MKSKKILIIITAIVMMLSLCIVASAAGSCSSNGDVTCDGKITTEDALKALRFVSEIDTPTAAQRNAADIDGDGKITIDDVRCIMMVSANVIPAPGHSFSNWVTTKRATCTAEGKAVCICTVCGEEHTKTLPKTEHITTTADCEHGSYCTVCNKQFSEPLGHDYKNGICRRCGSGMPIVEGDNYIYASGRQIFFGSGTSNITSLMGKPNDTFKINEHTFYVYSSNYNALVIVIFTDGKVTGVYTNADDVIICSGSSKETLSTAVSRVSKTKDIKTTYYTDNFAHNEKYAVLAEYGENDFGIYDVNSSAQAKLSFHITNGCRAINGIKPLKYNEQLGEVAYEHSADMGKRDYFSHVSPDGDDPKDRIINKDIIGACCGENIAAGYADAFVVTDAWYNSFDHRENVLDPEFTQLGVGVAYIEGSRRVYYYTQDFLG